MNKGEEFRSEAPPPYYAVPPNQPSFGYENASERFVVPQATAGTTTIVITNVVGIGRGPTNVECPNCKIPVVTATQSVPGTLTWILCIVIILLGGWMGCCLIPFCIPECQDIEHRCPNCKAIVGTYHRI